LEPAKEKTNESSQKSNMEVDRRSLCTGIINASADERSGDLRDHFEHVQYFGNVKGFSLNLFRWFEDNEYTILKDDRLHHTDRLSKLQAKHLKDCPFPRITALNGGNYHFPYSERDEMLKCLAADIEEGSPMYWNQIAYDRENEGTRLIVDIDSEGRVVDDSDVCRISRVLWVTLKEYFPKDFATSPIDTFIAKCGPRVKKGKMCTGIHIICHVKVSFEQARQIIYGYTLRLSKEPGMDMTGLTVDDSIYKESSKQVSIRMIYSSKIEDCPLCGGPRKEGAYACSFCDTRGRVSTKKTYEPLCCIHPETGKDDPVYFQQKAPDFFQLVKCYSIWPEARDAAHEFIKPAGDPVYAVKTDNKKFKPVGVGTKHMKKIKQTDAVYQLMEEFIRGLMWQGQRLWHRVDVDSVSLTENQSTAWISISGLDSSQCPYAMKDHGGNRMFFILSKKGKISVRCRSDKVEYGCKTKAKIEFDVPGTLVYKIFGVEGPGNPLRCSPSNPDERKNMNVADFIKRQSKEVSSLEKRRMDSADYEKQKRLKYITTYYKLGKNV
jgi:hypothetical protein